MSVGAQAAEEIRDVVRSGYAKIASGERSGCCGPTSCCGGASATATADALAAKVGYDLDELARLPEGANLGLSCGNPTALASLQEGEVVLDLGSGGGLDCFLAGPKVGPRGRVIGVDMTAEMISRARRNLESYRERTGLDNVEFRLGEIEHLPVADASVDVVLSNCVLNLSPDKPQVWREIARVLRPGGRVAISDIALLRPLPEPIRRMAEALVGCVAGAELVEDVRRNVEAAGLVDVRIEPNPGFIDAMTSTNDPLYGEIVAALPAGTRAGDYVASVTIEARKKG